MDSETPGEILDATGRALCEHGYAELTIKDIAAESSLSTAAIHYHFDTKEELLNAFLDHLIEDFEERLATDPDGPSERLSAFLEAVFTPAEKGSGAFAVALMELKSQAPYQETYRDRFRRMDGRMREEIETTVSEGTASGVFAETDPGTVARFVVTAINGGHVREVALGEGPSETRAVVEDFLEARLGWTPEGDA
ncbi:TetR/AcrR family transcriptional regulator [Halorhabdus amylolytica]|uniref:TetR/AcrR family transcriptional regulator n=1 Tax=Halorhabdus amylolytica TaxID=2559573 RepID=UPI0010AAAA9A|nr:TetR/AcrR family transcriptional regulator [Halorhabdus amylolytica]